MSEGRVQKSLNYLNWQYAIGAALEVFEQNKQAEANGGKFKACADVWCINRELREDIHERFCCSWCELTGCDRTYFPYSEDAVARLYFRLRKRTQDEVEGFEQEVRDALGKEGSDLFSHKQN